MKGMFLLDVVVREDSFVFEPFATVNEQFSNWAESALLVNYHGPNVLNRVRGLNIKGDGLALELNEDLHLVRSWLI